MTTDRPIPRKPKGFSDALEGQFYARQNMIERICSVYRRFGFSPLETPCIEYIDALGKVSSG